MGCPTQIRNIKDDYNNKAAGLVTIEYDKHALKKCWVELVICE